MKKTRGFAAIFIAVLLCLGFLPTAAVATTSNHCKPEANEEVNSNIDYTKVTRDEEQAIKLINAERAKNSLSPLEIDYVLLETASTYWFSVTHEFEYTHLDSSKCYMITEYSSNSIEKCVENWMNSQEHKVKILNDSFKSIGVKKIDKGSEAQWVLVLCPLTAGSITPDAPCGSYEEEVVKMLNVEREKRSLPPVVIDSELMYAAAIRAVEIVEKYEHTRPDGSHCTTVSPKANSENCAMGTINNSPKAVIEGWMNSDCDRENMLPRSCKSIGIGYYVKDSTRYCVMLLGYDEAANSDLKGDCDKPHNQTGKKPDDLICDKPVDKTNDKPNDSGCNKHTDLVCEKPVDKTNDKPNNSGCNKHTDLVYDKHADLLCDKPVDKTKVELDFPIVSNNNADNVSITIEADYDKFINCGGSIVNRTTNKALTREKDYTDKLGCNGGTIITLTQDYLKTLSNGAYQLQVNYIDSTYTQHMLQVSVSESLNIVTTTTLVTGILPPTTTPPASNTTTTTTTTPQTTPTTPPASTTTTTTTTPTTPTTTTTTPTTTTPSTIATVPVSSGASAPATSNVKTVPATGDDSNMSLWVALLALCALTIVVWRLNVKRHKHIED